MTHESIYCPSPLSSPTPHSSKREREKEQLNAKRRRRHENSRTKKLRTFPFQTRAPRRGGPSTVPSGGVLFAAPSPLALPTCHLREKERGIDQRNNKRRYRQKIKGRNKYASSPSRGILNPPARRCQPFAFARRQIAKRRRPRRGPIPTLRPRRWPATRGPPLPQAPRLWTRRGMERPTAGKLDDARTWRTARSTTGTAADCLLAAIPSGGRSPCCPLPGHGSIRSAQRRPAVR